METPKLKLVRRPVEQAARPSRGWPVIVLGTAILAAGLAATLLGADGARHPVDPQALAEEVVSQALESGNQDPGVRARLIELRRELSRSPLDSRSRVVYASLLLGLSRSVQDLEAPRFQARLAAGFAPVTVPVVRAATLVLARSGDVESALPLVRRMFGYAPDAAARLLMDVEPLVFVSSLDQGLPDDPTAWHAWRVLLRRSDRAEEADEQLLEAFRRWPDHLPTLQEKAARAVRRGDASALASLFPESRELPADAAAAPIYVHRARLRSMNGDDDGARQDIDRAIALDGGNVWVRILAGDAFRSLGDIERARDLWNSALFDLPQETDPRRIDLLMRLASLEHRHGEPAAALRLWRSVLEIDPENEGARRRVRELTGTGY